MVVVLVVPGNSGPKIAFEVVNVTEAMAAAAELSKLPF